MSDGSPVVVPLDGSKNGENAIPFAIAFARAHNAPIHFVHVIEDEVLKTEEDRDRANDAFVEYADRIAVREGVPAGHRASTLDGNAARVIIDYAADARMIVLATHGRSGVKATIVGSVADKIVRGTKVPALVVPAVGEAPLATAGPVVVGVDGSEASETALAAARDVVKMLGGKLIIVRAYSIPVTVGVEFAYYPPDLMTAMEQSAKEYLQQIAEPGEDSLLVSGNPAEAIEQIARDQKAVMVVVASHGKGLAARLALGSTTGRLMHSLQIPLLVVPVEGKS